MNWSGNRPISEFRVTINGEVVKNNKYDNPNTSGSDRINTSRIDGNTNVSIELVDKFGFKYIFKNSGELPPTEENAISPSDLKPTPTLDPRLEPTLPSIREEIPAPNITITNPSRSSISIYSGDLFNLRFGVQSQSSKKNISVKMDGNTLHTASSGENFVFPISSNGISEGNHTITVTAVGENGKSTSKNFTLVVLPR